MASPLLTCEHIEYHGSRVGWAYCGRVDTRLVTFPRRPPMILCEKHEREVTQDVASGVPSQPESVE
jgi:hypothetical protein